MPGVLESRKHYLFIVTLLLAAVLIRLLYASWLQSPLYGFTQTHWMETDEQSYDDAASGVLHGKIEYSIFAPGYYFFLALLYGIFGHSYTAVLITQSVLSALTAALLYAIGCILFTRWVGTITSVAFACYPSIIQFCTLLMTETLFLFLFILAFFHLLHLTDWVDIKRSLLIGLLLGLAILTRPTYHLFPFALIIPLYVTSGSHRKVAIQQALLIIVVSMLTLVPWYVRNYQELGKMVPISGALGEAVARGYIRYGNSETGNQIPLSPTQFKDAKQFSDHFLSVGARAVLSDPISALRAIGYRMVYLWSPDFKKLQYIKERPVFLFQVLSTTGLTGLALVGLILSLRAYRRLLLLYVTVVYYTVFTSLFIVVSRYKLQLIPFLLLFSAVACQWIVERLRVHWARQVSTR